MTQDDLLAFIKKTAESGRTSLDLRDNQLTTLPPEIGQLTSLTWLDLRDNQLTTLPPEIVQLMNLTELYLSGNQLTTLPPEIVQLTSLTTLYLGGNQLTTLPPEIVQLTSLTTLNLDRTQLSELPREIGQLTNLVRLDADYNQLTTLPPEFGRLTKLSILYLQGNRLTKLPTEITRLTGLTRLYLADNPLPIPPEIINKWKEPAAIINYYFEHQTGAKRPLNEAKVLVVGQGGVGKTSLVKQLVHGDFNPHENKTEGIDIQKWPVTVDGQDVRLNVWDFGGQEIMHATHQFFLTKRSLYLLVVDVRLGEDENRIEYWLKLIQSFGKDAPVIVVGNKSDQQPLDLDRRGLQTKYPNIKAFIETSCPEGRGIDELQTVIAREIGALPHIHDQLLLAWFAVKTKLEEMEEDYIPYQEYVRLCHAENVADELSQSTLIGFLHDLGIVLNFRDDPRLEDTNILNPEWVTDGVYKILNSNVLFQSKGALARTALSQILDPRKYPRDKHLFIMDMMRKFELCFDFEGLRDERFLIPDLLPKEEQDTGDWAGALAFQYHYNVLPSSIISRFIVRMHQYINMNTLWRTGVVLKLGGNRALVKSDSEDRKISIWVSGPEQARRRFLEVIRSHFDSIHKTIPGIVADEKVPLPTHPEIVEDYKHLLTMEAIGESHWIPAGLTERVNIKTVLDGVETEQARRLRQDERRGDERPARTSHPPPAKAPAGHPVPTSDTAALAALTTIKNKLDAGSERFARRCLYAYLIFFLAVVGVLAWLIYKLGWDKMEPWTYILGVVAAVVTISYFVITRREPSPRAIYDHIVEVKKLKSYQAAGFDLAKYKELNERAEP